VFSDVISILKSFTSVDFIDWSMGCLVDGLIMSYLVYSFFDVKTPKKSILYVALFYSICISLVRKIYIFYQIPFGTHSIILAILFMLIVAYFFKLSILRSAIGSFLCFTLIYIATPVIIKLISVFKINLEEISNPYILNLIGYLEVMFVIIALLIVKITGVKFDRLIG